MSKEDETNDDLWDKDDPEKSDGKSDNDDKGGDGDDGNKEMVKVGEKEIPLDELTDLVANGEEYGKLRKLYPDIKFDGLAKDYTDKTTRLSIFEKAEKEKKEAEGKQGVNEKEELAKKQVLDILAPAFKEMIKKEIGSNSAVNKYEDIVVGLEKGLDGNDGKPKFEREEIEKYMEEVGIANPKIAYEYKFKGELQDWEREHKNEQNVPFSEGSSGGGLKIPKAKKLDTYEDAEKATEQLLGQGQ